MSPPVLPLKERLRVGRFGSSIYSCSNAKSWRSPARRVMTPMCLLCRRTESALIVFGSNFIAQLRRRVLVSVGDVKGAFLAFTWLVFQVVADKGLHHGHKSAGHHVAGFDAGDMPLADAETAR